MSAASSLTFLCPVGAPQCVLSLSTLTTTLHLKILREIFKVEKPQGENHKTHHTIHMDKTRNSLGGLCILHFSTPSPLRKAWNFYEVLDQPKGVQRRLNF